MLAPVLAVAAPAFPTPMQAGEHNARLIFLGLFAVAALYGAMWLWMRAKPVAIGLILLVLFGASAGFTSQLPQARALACPIGNEPAQKLARAACEAGARGQALTTMVAIALAESGGRASAHCLNCARGVREDSRGAWQINVLAHPEYRSANLYDLRTNARAAWKISGRGRNWQPWSTYAHGQYRSHMATALAASKMGRPPKAPGFSWAGLLPGVGGPKVPGLMPSTAPVTGGRACPVPNATFTSSWHAPRTGHLHQGNDLMAPAGSGVYALAAGRVSRVTNRDVGLGGLSVWVTHGDGSASYYAHNARNRVRVGQQVAAGQRIADVGNSGNARHTGAHVHFELHPGGRGRPATDPYPMLKGLCRGAR